MNPRCTAVDEQVAVIMHGVDFGDPAMEAAMKEELRQRLTGSINEGRPLRVYAGYDPTKPDLHLGHSITLRKLKSFQDFGHDVYFVVGTFTARIGDASDKIAAREEVPEDRVRTAAETYAAQCHRILDPMRTQVVFNDQWLTRVGLDEFVRLTSLFTVQQFLVRDNFRSRIDRGDPIGLHELLYALFQGLDAVHLRADVQIGATEQLFNILAGRKLQQAYGQPPCVCLTYPILVGTDGKQRMSKSTGNYIGLTEPPEDQFGKTMSVSDATMMQWIDRVTRWSAKEIDDLKQLLKTGGISPMDAKKRLAWEIVSQFHGDRAAQEASEHFALVHQRGEVPQDLPVYKLGGPRRLSDALVEVGAAASRSAARRLIAGQGVRVDGAHVVEDVILNSQVLLKVGKRRFFRLLFSE